MKYLKTFEKLNDETYLSAADKLEKNHQDRARNLRKFVDDQQNIDIDYLDPRPMYSKDNVYYVTDVNVVPDSNIERDGNNIDVLIESVTDSYTLMISNWNDDNQYSTSIENTIRNGGTPWFQPPGYNTKGDKALLVFPLEFFFKDRRSARVFKDIVERESGEKLLCSVNDMYKS